MTTGAPAVLKNISLWTRFQHMCMNNSLTILWSIIMYNVNNAISTGEPPIGDYTSCKDRWGRGRESGRDPQLNLWENLPAKQPIVQWVLQGQRLCCFAPYLTPCNYLWWRERLWRFLLNGIFAMLKPHCQCFLTKNYYSQNMRFLYFRDSFPKKKLHLSVTLHYTPRAHIRRRMACWRL